MRIFAISDLHLSFASPKPMDVFGEEWVDHPQRLAASWKEVIQPEDTVLIAGDFSWAMRLEDAMPDFAWLSELPGKKILIRGNHDYWWEGITKTRAAVGERATLLQHDAVLLDGRIAVAGTRLWDFPEAIWPRDPSRPPVEFPPEVRERMERKQAQVIDAEKIRRREVERLRISLSAIPNQAEIRIAMLHFPPIGEAGLPTPLTAILEEFKIDLCVYGHLHGLGTRPRSGADCRIGRTRYLLTSSDWLAFQPRMLPLEEIVASSV